MKWKKRDNNVIVEIKEKSPVWVALRLSMPFELEHLESYDDAALLAELRRVAELVKTPKLTISQFSVHGKVHGSTLQKRFGGWKKALNAAGLGERCDCGNLSKSHDEIISTIKATAHKLGKESITLREFEAHSGMTGGPVRRLFGSWDVALTTAGMTQSPLGKRYTDEDRFENMLVVWTHYGRPPQHDEMNRVPSLVGSKGYIRRWGTWRKALEAFVRRVNSETPFPATLPINPINKEENVPPKLNRGSRSISLALRYYVLKRDGFRCVTCGASPAISPGVVLHIDHIYPWALGGATVANNLRTLCQDCNLGKGALP